MSMRVSSSQIAQSSLYGIQESYSRFNDALTKMNTGKQVQKPSDDPSGTAQSLNFREQVSEIDQFGRTLDQAKGYLGTSETALSSINSLVQQARSYAVQGASDNTSDEARQGLATQVQNIIQQIGNIGNTTYGSRHVFAGQRSDQPAFIGAGSSFAYQGGTQATGDGDINLDIGRSETMTINSTGDTVIAPILSALGQLRDNLSTNNSVAISHTDIAGIDSNLNTLQSVRADMGAKVQRIDQTKSRNDLTKQNYTALISNIEDADITKTYVDLQTAQTTYQAALTATARSFQSSLLDFLK